MTRYLPHTIQSYNKIEVILFNTPKSNNKIENNTSISSIKCNTYKSVNVSKRVKSVVVEEETDIFHPTVSFVVCHVFYSCTY